MKSINNKVDWNIVLKDWAYVPDTPEYRKKCRKYNPKKVGNWLLKMDYETFVKENFPSKKDIK